MQPLKLTLPTLLTGIVLALLPLAGAQAAPLNPNNFASLGANPFTQNGTYTVNSSASPPTLSGPGLAAPIHGAVANGIAVFTFNSLSLGSGMTLQGTGTLPIALLSQANATVGGAINVSGGGGSGGSGGAGGPGGAGGGAGGAGGDGGGGGYGGGEGGGEGGDGGSHGGTDGSGGSYGGDGGGIYGGSSYGDLTQTLQGGSGGGGGGSNGYGSDGGGGGGGGGALEIGAEGALAITGSVHADGGNAGQVSFWGGGGSGGGLIAFGSTVTLSGSARLSAVGGTSGDGGGGGGGRILIASEYSQAANIATYVTVAGGATPNDSNGGDGVLTLAVGTVAQNASASVGHRSGAGVDIPLSAANALGHAVTYSLVGTNGGAAHGTVSLSGSTAHYTPIPGNTFVGDDAFQFQATDGIAASAPATVTVHLTNAAPVAQPDSYQTAQNTILTVAAPGVLANDTDAEGDRLSAQLVTGPAYAASFALHTDGSFTYIPAAGYFGTDSFTYEANDGYADSSTVTVTLTVVGTPTANPQSVNVPFNTAKAVTLSGSDPNSPVRSLTYTVMSNPAHGTLTGTAPNLTYTPTAGYHGADSFQFTVSNGVSTSTPATVSLAVATGVPTASDQGAIVAFNTAKAITLTGSDPDVPALTLTYTVMTAPTHGTLSGTAPNLTYTPASNYHGSDAFAFTTSNGANTSSAATVALTVAAGTPTANAQSVSVAFNTSKAITLTGTDPDVPALTLTYSVFISPSEGTLSGTAPNLTYTPTAGYHGTDAFYFQVSNGFNINISIAKVSLTVAAGMPTANPQGVAVAFNTAKAVTLTGSDPDSPALPLTYSVVTAPTHGALSGMAPNLTYTPTAGYHGTDSFTFTVNNGTNTCAPATVSLTVATGTPTANAQSIGTSQDTPVSVTLTGSDPDVPALTLTYSVTTSPTHGTLSGTAPNLTYTPAPGYYGADSFTFTASNGTNASAAATVSLTVAQGAAADVTAQITLTRGGFRYVRATGHYLQPVTLANTGAALADPLSLVLDGLTGATLVGASGTTATALPAGSPYVTLPSGGLAAGASVTVTLEFTAQPSGYTPRVLAGPGAR